MGIATPTEFFECPGDEQRTRDEFKLKRKQHYTLQVEPTHCTIRNERGDQ